MLPDSQIDSRPPLHFILTAARPDMKRLVLLSRFTITDFPQSGYCKLPNANFKLAICILQFAFCFFQSGAGRLLAQKDPYAEFIAQTNPRTPEEERKGFHLPPGFEVQLVAAEPDVRKPININFDDHGRLWVTESIEYPFAAQGNP